MNIVLLLLATINLLLLVGLTTWIRSRWRSVRTEESEGALYHYRHCVHGVFHREFSNKAVLCVIHYLSLHLLIPLTGLAFLLRSDLNFLVVVVSILFSMQIYQRIYPGLLPYEDQESGGDDEAGNSLT